MIFTVGEKVLMSIKHCPMCNRRFVEQPNNTGCLHPHELGSCCHKNDTMITLEQYCDMMKILDIKTI